MFTQKCIACADSSSLWLSARRRVPQAQTAVGLRAEGLGRIVRRRQAAERGAGRAASGVHAPPPGRLEPPWPNCRASPLF